MGLGADNPAFKIKKYPEKRKDRFLQMDEIWRLQDALNAAELQKTETRDVIACFRFSLLTGLRCGEVLNLVWSEIDVTAKTIKFQYSKTGPRTVPLNDQAWEVILQHREIKDSGYVIKSATGEGRPALGKPWYRIRKQADTSETANIHCLRHTFASWAIMGDLSLAQTGALLGHKSTQTTLRYADHLTEVVREYSQKTANQFMVDRTHRNQ